MTRIRCGAPAWLLAAALGLGAGVVQAKPVTLNMKGADINAVIATVAEVTGRNFIVDPRVKGKVTIISSKTMDEQEIYQVFLAILDVHGFTAVPAGNVIKILPDADAKHSGIPNEGEGEEVVTQVYEIRHVQAAQLVPILRPLVPPQGHLAAHAQTNTLILSDRVSNIERLISIIERIDEPSGSEIEVLTLQHASAAEVVRILTSLRQQEKKADPKASVPTLVADERTNSILLGGEKSDRLQIKAIIAHLDTPSETIGNTHVVYLRYAKAKDMVSVLTGVGKIQAKDGGKGAKTATAARAKGDFDIQADEAANALVITAAPDIFRSLQSVIQKLDVRRAQVLVEAIIAEVSANKTAELGVQWAAGGENPGKRPVGILNFGGTRSITGIGQAAAQAESAGINPGLGALGSVGSGLTLGIGSINKSGYSFASIINALAGTGAANLLSTPNILTMDNEEAEIFVGKTVKVPSGSYTQTGGTTSTVSNPFTTFDSQDVGVRLKVKPQINEGDAIKLELEQSVDAITAGNAGEANLVTSTRTVKTSVMVEDGQTVVLGGLLTDDQTNSIQKVPLLGDLPLIGALFRYKSDTQDKTNLMVFLKPQILRDAATTTDISSSKYNFMRARQLSSRFLEESREAEPLPLMPALEGAEQAKTQVAPPPPPLRYEREPGHVNRLPEELQEEGW